MCFCFKEITKAAEAVRMPPRWGGRARVRERGEERERERRERGGREGGRERMGKCVLEKARECLCYKVFVSVLHSLCVFTTYHAHTKQVRRLQGGDHR